MHYKQSGSNVTQQSSNRWARLLPKYDKCITFLELSIGNISSKIHLPPGEAPLTEPEDE